MKKKLSKSWGIAGIVFQIIGAWLLFVWIFFGFIGLFFFILGSILLWFSTIDIKLKITVTSLLIISGGVYQYIHYFINKGDSEIYLIPIDYRGKVEVIFNESCGSELTYNNDGERVYKISKEGILILKDSFVSGYLNRKYYTINANGETTLIRSVWNSKNAIDNELSVYGEKRRYSEYKCDYFYIASNQTSLDSFMFNRMYEKMTDSLHLKLVTDCRNK